MEKAGRPPGTIWGRNCHDRRSASRRTTPEFLTQCERRAPLAAMSLPSTSWRVRVLCSGNPATRRRQLQTLPSSETRMTMSRAPSFHRRRPTNVCHRHGVALLDETFCTRRILLAAERSKRIVNRPLGVRPGFECLSNSLGRGRQPGETLDVTTTCSSFPGCRPADPVVPIAALGVANRVLGVLVCNQRMRPVFFRDTADRSCSDDSVADDDRLRYARPVSLVIRQCFWFHMASACGESPEADPEFCPALTARRW